MRGKKVRLMKRAAIVTGILGALAGLMAVVRKRKRNEPLHSPRSEQATVDGTPVVEEWGVESFPASDPPQSW